MGTKENPGGFDCYHNAAPDEPMFILLARDAQAPKLVRAWARGRADLIGTGRKDANDALMVSEALECADAMEAYRNRIKAPDPACRVTVAVEEPGRHGHGGEPEWVDWPDDVAPVLPLAYPQHNDAGKWNGVPPREAPANLHWFYLNSLVADAVCISAGLVMAEWVHGVWHGKPSHPAYWRVWLTRPGRGPKLPLYAHVIEKNNAGSPYSVVYVRPATTEEAVALLPDKASPGAACAAG